MTELDWFIAAVLLLAAMWFLREPIKHFGEWLQSAQPFASTAVKTAKAAAEIELLRAQAPPPPPPVMDVWRSDSYDIIVSAVKLGSALRLNGVYWSDEDPPVVLLSQKQWVQFTGVMTANPTMWLDALATKESDSPSMKLGGIVFRLARPSDS